MVAIASTCVAQEVAEAAEAESFPVSFNAGVDLYSHYLWRGIEVNDEPVAQPAGTATFDLEEFGSVSAGVWANYAFSNSRKGDGRTDGFNEVDYTLNYGIDVSDFSLEVGHIWYTFPRRNGSDGASTREVYGAVAYNNDIVTPSLAVYYDYADIEGTYAVAALSKDIEINEQLTAGVFASMGAGDDNYNKGYGLTTDSALIDGNIGASLTYAIDDTFTVGATVVWSSVLDDGIRNNVDPVQDRDWLWGGINFAAAF